MKIGDYYTIKDAGDLIIKGKDYEINIDIANEVHVIKTDKMSIVTLAIEIIDDELEEKLCDVKKSEINLKLKCKRNLTGEDIIRERLFKNMKFVKKEVRYNPEGVSTLLFVFADKNYRRIKDVLNDHFNRNNIAEHSSFLNCELYRITNSIKSIEYTLKDKDEFQENTIKKVIEEIVKCLTKIN